MDSKANSRSSSRNSSISTASTTSRRSQGISVTNGSRKTPSRQPSSASTTQKRPALGRASSSTASLTNEAMLKTECFGGSDSHNYSRKVQIACQMLPGTEIVEEKHRHNHSTSHSYRCTIPVGLLAVDHERGSPYRLGGLVQSGLLDEALDDLKRGASCIGATLNMTAGIWDSGKGKTINCIDWGASRTAEPEPVQISQYFGCQAEMVPRMLDPRPSRDVVTIRLRQLEGLERDLQCDPFHVFRGKAYLYKAQYRLTATSKTLGDLTVPLIQRKAILVESLLHSKHNKETQETGALFVGKAKVTNGMLDSVAWKTGTWQAITKAGTGF